MSDTLIDKLKARLEFDEGEARRSAKRMHERQRARPLSIKAARIPVSQPSYIAGARFEVDRRCTVDEALVECVNALERVQCQCTIMERDCGHRVDCWNMHVPLALDKLRAALEDK